MKHQTPGDLRPQDGTVSPDISTMQLVELLRHWRSRVPELWQKDLGNYISTGERMLGLGEPLIAHDVLAEALKRSPADVRLRQLQALALLRAGAADSAEIILLGLEAEGNQEEETIGLLARLHKGRWENEKTNLDAAAQELSLAHTYYRKAYGLDGGYWSGINAATTALLLGRKEESLTLARKVRQSCQREHEQAGNVDADNYWLLATLAEAALILEDWPEAESLYRRVAKMGRGKFGNLASTRRNALLILNYFGQTSTSIEKILRIPPVVVFSGHMIDAPGRPAPRFPADLEGPLRQAIRDRLEKINPGFGYASAASGSDILFLESLLEIGGEAHIVLPYNQEEFLKDSVDVIPDGNWSARFEYVIDKATEVLNASDYKVEGKGVSYEYANLVLYGLAATRARQLGAQMVPLAVWDGKKGRIGGTAMCVELWKKNDLEVEVIDLEQILKSAGRDCPQVTSQHQREESIAADMVPEIAYLLFADALHFSRLNEAQIPLFLRHFLGAIGELLQRTSHQPVMRNTWGDGLFMIFQSVEDAGGFALELCDLITQTKWAERALPAELNLRIGLHAGPVFECIDPISEKQNFFGTHVSRAARIEPITPPGQVYASQGFAALAAVQGLQTFVCDYVGQVPQAKGYGTFPTFHVHRAP